MTDKDREDIECFLVQFYDKMDPTKANSEFFQTKWAKMSNSEFERWLKKDYPLRFHIRTWENDPGYKQFKSAANFLGVNMLEEVALPYLYKNKDGIPINSKPALKMFLPIKKMQQFITKKNKISIDIDDRDMKSGRLNTQDKGSAMSNKEFECLAIMGLTNTMKEFSTIRADAMNAKSEAYNQISITGKLSNKDYVVSKEDSLSRNLINVYFLGCHISTNLLNENGYTSYTLKEKDMRTQRID